MDRYRAWCRKILNGNTYVFNINLGFDIELKDRVLKLKEITCPPARGKDKCSAGVEARDFAIDRVLNTEVIIDVEDFRKGLITLYAKDHIDEEGEQVYVDFGSLLVEKGLGKKLEIV